MRTVRIRLSFIMDRRVSQRQPLALLAGRCGPAMTRKKNASLSALTGALNLAPERYRLQGFRGVPGRRPGLRYRGGDPPNLIRVMPAKGQGHATTLYISRPPDRPGADHGRHCADFQFRNLPLHG